MGNEEEMKNPLQIGLQVEGKTECARGQAERRRQLLGNILSNPQVELHLLLPDPVAIEQFVHKTS